MDLNELTSAGKLWVILLMVIGGSPASAAGGLKTLTLVILLGVIWSTLRGRRQPSLLGRPLAPALVERTLTLAGLYLACFLVGTVTLAVTQGPTSRFMDVLFEAASALGTAGLSLGETLRLKTESKFVISALMLLGRLGPLVLLISLAPRGPAGQGEGADELVLA
jgi:trk system potassium uptake protein TrkH